MAPGRLRDNITRDVHWPRPQPRHILCTPLRSGPSSTRIRSSRAAPRPIDGESVLWVGAATRDTGISLTRLTFQITHATDADTNEERDFIISELQSRQVIENVHSYAPGERLAIGRVNRYITDGEISVANLVAIA